MIQLTTSAAMTKAIDNAKAARLHVCLTSTFRQYVVENRSKGTSYRVNFFVTRGQRWAECECKAGFNGQMCKHVAAAAGLHVMIAAARSQMSH